MIAPVRHAVTFPHTDCPLVAASRLIENGQYRPAHRMLLRVLADNPNDACGWELLGRIHEAWKQIPQAINCLENSLRAISPSVRRLLQLARLYQRANRDSDALAAILQALEHPQAQADELLKVAKLFAAVGCQALAIEACRRCVKVDPDCDQGYYELSQLLSSSGAPANLIETAARKAIQLNPENCEYRIGLAGFLLQHERAAEAGRLVAEIPDSHFQTMSCPCCLVRLIRIFEITGDHGRVLSCDKQLRRLAVKQAEVRN
jgi:tetratricopeptide (TPR) repeat protein